MNGPAFTRHFGGSLTPSSRSSSRWQGLVNEWARVGPRLGCWCRRGDSHAGSPLWFSHLRASRHDGQRAILHAPLTPLHGHELNACSSSTASKAVAAAAGRNGQVSTGSGGAGTSRGGGSSSGTRGSSSRRWEWQQRQQKQKRRRRRKVNREAVVALQGRGGCLCPVSRAGRSRTAEAPTHQIGRWRLRCRLGTGCCPSRICSQEGGQGGWTQGGPTRLGVQCPGSALRGKPARDA